MIWDKPKVFTMTIFPSVERLRLDQDLKMVSILAIAFFTFSLTSSL